MYAIAGAATFLSPPAKPGSAAEDGIPDSAVSGSWSGVASDVGTEAEGGSDGSAGAGNIGAGSGARNGTACDADAAGRAGTTDGAQNVAATDAAEAAGAVVASCAGTAENEWGASGSDPDSSVRICAAPCTADVASA
mmetsp:Transcript_16931/g.46895  ORF Transcript_16931/g.46895 Transcript_16931/m.46895 type:complete len:137 (-) Transcript_16931:103-513(-)